MISLIGKRSLLANVHQDCICRAICLWQDCERASQLGPRDHKAAHRRIQALKELGLLQVGEPINIGVFDGCAVKVVKIFCMASSAPVPLWDKHSSFVAGSSPGLQRLRGLLSCKGVRDCKRQGSNTG